MQLVTWNTQWCRGLDGRVDPARIVQYAVALGDVDVLCLQEIAVNYPGLAGAPGDQVAQVQSALPAGWQVFFGAAVDEWTAAGRQRFGNLIATRLPVLQLQHHPLPYPPDAGVRSMPRLSNFLPQRILLPTTTKPLLSPTPLPCWVRHFPALRLVLPNLLPIRKQWLHLRPFLPYGPNYRPPCP